MRHIVIPGELVVERPMRVGNTFIEGDKAYSKILGLYESSDEEIIPLEGIWEPHVGDTVVGIVAESRNRVYEIELSYFKRAILVPGRYERYELRYGDIIQAGIKDIEGNKTIVLSEPKVLSGGTILKIKPTKVPRVIGKKSTMVKQIAESTKSHIAVGVNGIVWICGGNATLAIEAILRIEKEAHVPGLTERIKQMLESGGVN
jgi:exosome complex component RRP4